VENGKRKTENGKWKMKEVFPFSIFRYLALRAIFDKFLRKPEFAVCSQP
jgi:hypothetical protein